MKLINTSIFSLGLLLLVSGTAFAELCSYGSTCSFQTPDQNCQPRNTLGSSLTDGGNGICPLLQRIVEVKGPNDTPLAYNTTYVWDIPLNTISWQLVANHSGAPNSLFRPPYISGVNNMQNIVSHSYLGEQAIEFTTGPQSGGTPQMSFSIENPNHFAQTLFDLKSDILK